MPEQVRAEKNVFVSSVTSGLQTQSRRKKGSEKKPDLEQFDQGGEFRGRSQTPKFDKNKDDELTSSKKSWLKSKRKSFKPPIFVSEGVNIPIIGTI